MGQESRLETARGIRGSRVGSRVTGHGVTGNEEDEPGA